MLYSKSFFSRIIIGLLFFSQGYGTINVHGQSMPIATPSKDKNYIISHTPRQGEDSINEISHKKRGTQITYFDGLGRKMQQIGFLQSPDEKNFVQSVVYDELGRKSKQFLPYVSEQPKPSMAFQQNWEQNQQQFYNNLYGNEGDYAFSRTDYDNSPLNRVMAELGPGRSWHSGTGGISEETPTTFTYQTNADSLMNFTVEENGSLTEETYEPGTLYMLKTTDEDGRLFIEWKDFRGNVVRTDQGDDDLVASTLYVYDDFDLLRWVIPPEAGDLIGSTLSVDDNIAKGLCYYYEYDKRRRLIKKRIPGAEAVYYVYDNRDRLVMSQDGNQRNDEGDLNDWTIHKYDTFDRLEYSAIIARTHTQSSLQGMFNHNMDNTVYEWVDNENKILKNWWDASPAMTWPDGWSFITPDGWDHPDDQIDYSKTINTRGLLMASRERIVNSDGSLGDNVYSRYFYDEKGRLIQSLKQTDEHGSYLHHFHLLNWAGDLKKDKTVFHYYPSQWQEAKVYSLLNENTYDHAGRLLETTTTFDHQDYNAVDYVLEIEYDALGRVKKQEINDAITTQSLYNIRDWITEMDYSTSSGTAYNFNLAYETGSDNPEFGGNITSAEWSAYDGTDLTYEYIYDGLNRLTEAVNTPENNFSTNYTYDLQGNLQWLTRRGKLENEGSFVTLDSLKYTYSGSSNKLGRVLNYSPHAGQGGFDNMGIDPFGMIGIIYDYDANGNMVYDHRLTREINYNFLNLPSQITLTQGREANMIHYTYTTSGQKLSQQLEEEGRSGTLRRYAGPFVVENGELKWVNTPEGRMIESHLTRDEWINEFHLRDHLGNIRVTITEEPDFYTLTQTNHYYPFGMRITGLSEGGSSNRYLYNDKEFQDDFELNWYDFHARFYMPDIGRTTTMDPHAENYENKSPYSFMGNNPIKNIDPTGMDWYTSTDGTATMWKEGSADIEGYKNIGATYTQTIGDGVTISYSQNEASSITFNSADNSSWETSQTSEYSNCYKASTAMVKNEGAETGGRANEILVTEGTDKGRAGNASANAQEGISAIDNTIENGEPLIVGVDYRDGHPGNADKRTDHFIVVRGKTEQLSNGQVTSKTYNYMDPGTSHSSKGTSPSRTLSITNNRITGKHMNNPKLKVVVTTVRPNK